MRHLLLPVVLLICAPACAAGLPPMPLASVPALSAGPRLDGRLEDAAWKDAALLGPLCRADGAGMPEAGTVARVFAGGEHLALGIVCEEPEMARLQSAPAGHDAQIWVGDCVEVFVQPSAGRPYLHFVTNAHGARYEEREKDSSWDAPWEAAGYRGDGRWSVEILLSWAALGGRPAAGAQWRLNVCRSRRPQMETSTWSPTGGGFHVPERFGTVRFGATAWLADLDWGRPWRGAQRLQARGARGARAPRRGGAAPAPPGARAAGGGGATAPRGGPGGRGGPAPAGPRRRRRPLPARGQLRSGAGGSRIARFRRLHRRR